MIEQEATILRTNIQTLESENEKLVAENKQLHLLRLKKGSTEKESEVGLKGKLTSLETELAEAYNKVTWYRVKDCLCHHHSLVFPPASILSLLSLLYFASVGFFLLDTLTF